MKIDHNVLLAAVESDEYVGFCTACGDRSTGVEPDAQKYPCGNCGADRVFGAESLLLGSLLFGCDEGGIDI